MQFPVVRRLGAEQAAPDHTFTPDTIEHPMQPAGGRDLATYENRLGFNRAELEGAVVLDLGSGPTAKFATNLHEAGIAAAVVSLSPDYATRRHLESAQAALARVACTSLLVPGLGQSLPFEDEVFDYVMALHVVEHLRSPDIRRQTVAEAARVLAPGGLGFIGPIIDIPLGVHPYRELVADNDFMRTLAKRGISLAQYYIPTHIMPPTRVQDRNFVRHTQPNYSLHITKRT
jgi:SAM-dependent methyltransferase